MRSLNLCSIYASVAKTQCSFVDNEGFSEAVHLTRQRMINISCLEKRHLLDFCLNIKSIIITQRWMDGIKTAWGLVWAQLCQLQMVPRWESVISLCDTGANHCPQLCCLSLNDAIWNFSKAIVLTEDNILVIKHACQVCHFTCFSSAIAKNGILLLKVGEYVWRTVRLKVGTPKQTLCRNSSALNSPDYSLAKRSFSFKGSLQARLHRGKELL